MHLQSEDRRLAQVMERIAALDLTPIKFKIGSKEDGYGWTPEHIDRVEHGYKRFLALLAMHPGRQLAPTVDIDKFWHAHILDTRKYAVDCEMLFGEFLHHNPYLGMLGDKDRLDEAAQSLHNLFKSDFDEAVPFNAVPGEGPADAAWCGGDGTVDKAAWCGGETTVKNAAAWCGGETTVKNAAAWCGGETTVKNAAAWCGGETTVKKAAAWCGGETTAKNAAAWCGGETTVKNAAAWCGGETTAKKVLAETAAAWCGGEVATH